MRIISAVTLSLLVLCGASQAGGVSFNPMINDPDGTYDSYHDGITSDLLAAGAAWAQYLIPTTEVAVNVQVNFANLGTETIMATSPAQGYLYGGDPAKRALVYNSAAVNKMLVGGDTDTPDIILTINTTFLPQLWFDSNPFAKNPLVPSDKYDAVTIFTHELSHGIFMWGFKDTNSGASPIDTVDPEVDGWTYESGFDYNIADHFYQIDQDGVTYLFPLFEGQNLLSLFTPDQLWDGGFPLFYLGVPGTSIYHPYTDGDVLGPYGNLGASLRELSLGDVALLSDSLPEGMVIPEPGTAGLLGMAFGFLLLHARSSRRVR